MSKRFEKGDVDMRKISNIPLKLVVSLSVLAYAVILYVTPLGCPVLELTGIPCFGCGITRALISAVRLDFAAAFKQHFMFFSVPILYACLWLDGMPFKSKKANWLFYGIVLLGFIINWAFQLFFV